MPKGRFAAVLLAAAMLCACAKRGVPFPAQSGPDPAPAHSEASAFEEPAPEEPAPEEPAPEEPAPGGPAPEEPAPEEPVPEGSPSEAAPQFAGEEDLVRELLADTNAARETQGVSALRLNDELCAAARLRAQEAAALWSHDRPDGSVWYTVLQEGGISYAEAGENLFCANVRSAHLAVEHWMASPAHRENLLRESFTEVGFGVFEGGDGYWYYTQIFRTP